MRWDCAIKKWSNPRGGHLRSFDQFKSGFCRIYWQQFAKTASNQCWNTSSEAEWNVFRFRKAVDSCWKNTTGKCNVLCKSILLNLLIDQKFYKYVGQMVADIQILQVLLNNDDLVFLFVSASLMRGSIRHRLLARRLEQTCGRIKRHQWNCIKTRTSRCLHRHWHLPMYKIDILWIFYIFVINKLIILFIRLFQSCLCAFVRCSVFKNAVEIGQVIA